MRSPRSYALEWTGGDVFRRHPEQVHRDRGALLPGGRTPGPEGVAASELSQVGRLTGNGAQLAGRPPRLEPRDRLEQRTRVRVPGPAEDLTDRARLDDVACVH